MRVNSITSDQTNRVDIYQMCARVCVQVCGVRSITAYVTINGVRYGDHDGHGSDNIMMMMWQSKFITLVGLGLSELTQNNTKHRQRYYLSNCMCRLCRSFSLFYLFRF